MSVSDAFETLLSSKYEFSLRVFAIFDPCSRILSIFIQMN